MRPRFHQVVRGWAWLIPVLAASISPSWVRAQDATTPGELSTPHPTLENLSIVWEFEGDDDGDGEVTVRYRQVGAEDWREGLPLRRVPAGSNVGHSWTNKHSGSVFNLLPGTAYEVEVTLTDPDGGSTTETATANTRPVPAAAANGRMRPASPADLESVLQSAEPGDVVVLEDGSYGGFSVDRSGTPDEPVVIRAATAGAATVDGNIRLDGTEYVFLEDLTINGTVRLDGTTGAVVQRCAITTTGSGVVAFGQGATDAYVCDNVVLGPTTWREAALGASGDNLGEGIELTGPGNVICYNRVEGFRDAISTLEQQYANDQQSIDIYNNDINIGADDGIEADFTMGNVRVLRNRIRNSFMGISGQPTLGGPAYYIRNVMYNIVAGAFKLNRGGSGDIGIHNTVVKCGDGFGVYAGQTFSHAYYRNNLFLGGEGNDVCWGNGSVVSLADADATSSFDYNGYGSVGTGEFRGRIGGTRVNSLAELQTMTTEVHAVEVDLDVFADAIAFPGPDPLPERDHPDLRLAAGGGAVDRGVSLPNINDGFLGAGPDLGAYESGSLLPHYGPRGDETAVCGNGTREADEECDDANDRPADGCSPTCRLEVIGPDGGVVTLPPDGPPGVRDGGLRGGPGADPDPSGEDAGGCEVSRGRPSVPAAIGLWLLALWLRCRGRRKRPYSHSS